MNGCVIKSLYLDKVKGNITEKQFMEFISIFTIEKNELLIRKETISREVEGIKDSMNDANKYKEIVIKYKDFTELNSILVNDLIDYIEIGKKDVKTKEQKVIIHWLF